MYTHFRSLFIAGLFSPLVLYGQAELTDLKTEHLECPIGLDTPHPRFSWRMAETGDAVEQMQYRILVGTDSLTLASGHGDAWDSGNCKGASSLVVYDGKPLKPFTPYYWRVVVTDKASATYRSPIARFETGLMDQSRWRGAWIDDGKSKDYLPAPYFRKGFRIEKPVARARVYLAVAGLYELQVNGKPVGDRMLDPLYTRFDRRNLYVTHDVTTLLTQGDNALGVVLGNGWYNHQSKAVWDFDNAPWRNRPAFCLDLRIQYQDGTEQVVATDLSWRSGTGELRRNSIYTGVLCDYTQAQEGWSSAGFDESKWGGVRLRSVPSANVTAQQARPIRIDWEREAVSVRQVSDSVWLYDFGQNMAGVTRLKAKGIKGTTLHIRHGERLDEQGNLDQSNIDVYYRGDKAVEPFQTDEVVLSGGDDEFLTPFNYKGFRYAEVTVSPVLKHTGGDMAVQTPAKDLKLTLTACFVHSDVPQVGEITASDPIIGKLMHASRMSYLSNLMGYPTDCPQREKNGWTGDGHLAIEAALYNYDAITVYEKWMADHRDEQQPNGVLPDIIPTGGWGYGTDNGLDWTSTIALIPWNLYLFYGDERPLRECYPHIKRYVDYVDKNYPSHLTTWGRGDWVPVSVGSNKELTSSVYFYADAQVLARAAALFGYTDDAQYYAGLATSIRTAINDKYFNPQEGVYASGTQTELSVPLYWGVVPDEYKALVAKNLNDKVVAANHHLDVGVLGCKALLNALCQNGYTETAYKVAVQDTYPAWGWWVTNGATTLLENWDLKATRDISDNHMMFGEIGAWFYKGIAGIYPDAKDPGFHHIQLKPYMPAGLKQFSASHVSPYGKIVSGWETRRGRIHYTAVIPANSSATLTLPDGTVQQLKSGTHTFVLKKK